MFISGATLVQESTPRSKLIVNTKVGETFVQKRIMIQDRETSELLWTGNVEVDGIVERILPAKFATSDYLIVKALDDAAVYNAVVADYVQADVVP